MFLITRVFSQGRTEEMLGVDVKIDPTRLYLAQFSEDGQWYRAAPRSSVDPDGKVRGYWTSLVYIYSFALVWLEWGSAG